ncbi:MAG: type II CAAX endopeptidase family protein [Bacteroidota bacterium]|nr:type II CAAX endopeptidase family protein [Bacteroidota bacterium]
MLSAWKRLPLIVRAILTGGIAAAVGTFTWSLLVQANLKILPGVPWSIFPASFFLWIFWRYLQGKGWPRSTSEIRKTNLRANRLSGDVWASAIFAGILGLIALLLFMRVMNRMIRLPQQEVADLVSIPRITLFFLLLMGSAVAGIVEEASFRGYMQGPIERRYGPVMAILITGLLFGSAHFVHPETTVALMPFYLGVAAVYGMLAYITNSILPGMILHAVGNVFGGIDLLTSGQSEWQASTKPMPLIWEKGTDSSFRVSCIIFIVFGIAAIWAYKALAAVVRKQWQESNE